MTAARPLTTVERPFARSVIVAADPVARLTERQREVLRAVATVGTVDATRLLFVEMCTLKNILSAVYARLGLTGAHDHKGARAAYLLGMYDAREGR